MRFLTLPEVMELHRLVLSAAGGASGIRDLGALESALAQPQMSFGAEDLYPTLVDKAAALCFSLVSNHPFVDGNKRVGHAAMETFLVLNGVEITAPIDDQEQLILTLAAGRLDRSTLVEWLHAHLTARATDRP
jgi:death-on-curing protein